MKSEVYVMVFCRYKNPLIHSFVNDNEDIVWCKDNCSLEIRPFFIYECMRSLLIKGDTCCLKEVQLIKPKR